MPKTSQKKGGLLVVVYSKKYVVRFGRIHGRVRRNKYQKTQVAMVGGDK